MRLRKTLEVCFSRLSCPVLLVDLLDGKINLPISNFKKSRKPSGALQKWRDYTAFSVYAHNVPWNAIIKTSANLSPNGNQCILVEISRDLSCLVFTVQTNKCHLSCNFHHGIKICLVSHVLKDEGSNFHESGISFWWYHSWPHPVMLSDIVGSALVCEWYQDSL